MTPAHKQNSSFSNGVQFAWDSTSIDLWETCPRKYYYVMYEGWQPKQLSVHLAFGKVYASSLEEYHKLRAAGMEYEDALRAVVRKALVDTWDKKKSEPIDWVDNNKTRFTLIRSIIWYLENYRNDTMKTFILKDGKPAVEFSFQIPADNGIILTGHLDRVVNYADGLYVQDQKTTGSAVGSYYFTQFDMSGQMTQYTFAAKMIYKLPIKGVCVDAAQIAVGSTRFGRYFTNRTDSQLDEWYEDTIYKIGDAQAKMDEGHFPMNRSSCTKYGRCPFFDVCAAPLHIRKNILKGDFTQDKVWDPLKER